MKNGKGPLDKYIGQRVGIVRTGKGKATVVGYVTIAGKVEYNTEKEFWRDRDKHKIRKKTNPTYYWNGKKKVGYILENPVKLDVKDQYEVSERGIVARDIDPDVQDRVYGEKGSPYYYDSEKLKSIPDALKTAMGRAKLFTYKGLTSVKSIQMKKTKPPKYSMSTNEIAKMALNDIRRAGGVNSEDDAIVFVDSIGIKVSMSMRAAKHNTGRSFDYYTYSNAYSVLGDTLKNAIPINEITPRSQSVDNTYVLAGASYSSNGDVFITLFFVNARNGEVEKTASAYSANAKKRDMGSQATPRSGKTAVNHISSTLKIADLLDFVKDNNPEYLSGDVLAHYGFSERPQPNRDEKHIIHSLYSTRDNLDAKQKKNYDFNEKQTETGSKLKTLNGSDIARNKAHGLGKLIGGTIYFHKSYVYEFIGKSEYQKALDALHEYDPDFKFNGIRYDITQNVKGSVNPHFHQISFQEAPGFDTEREPIVGRTINVEPDGTVWESKNGRNTIWHHKWIWVRNDYTGFDVNESWEWSKEWLSVLTEPSNGSNTENWNKQLDKYGLPHDSTVRYSNRNEQTITSEDTSLNQTPSTFTNFLFNSNDRILDYGGGKYDTAKLAMESTYPGITIEVYDPYNRTESHNERILSYFKKEKANVVTINNVLNVINSTDAIEDVIKGAKEYLASDGVAYIAIYEGNGSGVGAETSSGYQNNAKAGWYVQFAEKYFRYVKKSGTFILCSDSPITSVKKIDSATKSVLNGNTAKFKKEKKNMKDSLYSSRDNKGNRIYTQSDIDKLATKFMGMLIAERAKNDANLAAVGAEAKAKIDKMKFKPADARCGD